MEKNVYSLITALVVVLALMGVLLVISEENKVENSFTVEKKLPTDELITIEHDVVKKSQKTNVVTEDYVRDLDSDAKLVVMTENGSAYSVVGGRVLVDGRVVTVEDEVKEVRYLDTPIKTVSTE